MGIQQLDNLVRIRQLKAEPPTQEEFDGLIRSGKAKLQDSEKKDLNLESRFDLAYNAAHAFSLAALRWHGYRSEHRFTVFQCLSHTLQLPPELWRVLDQAHRDRNVAEYEGDFTVELPLIEALIRVTHEVASRVAQLGALPPVDATHDRA